MRSYNFVVDITPDIEDYQYRIRAIDFDQQCYEGKMKLYMPHFFKENKLVGKNYFSSYNISIQLIWYRILQAFPKALTISP